MPYPMEYEPIHIIVDEPVMMCHQLGKVDLEAGFVHCQKQQYAGLVWTVFLVMLVAASVVAPMMEHWALALDAIALLFIVIASCMVLRGPRQCTLQDIHRSSSSSSIRHRGMHRASFC